MPATPVDASALITELIAETGVEFMIGKTTIKLPSPFDWPALPDNPLEWLDVILSKGDATKFRRAAKAEFGIASETAGLLFFRLYPKIQAAAAGITSGE